MQRVYLKKMTKQDIEKSVSICTESVESFWGVSLADAEEYTDIKICSIDDPSYCPNGISIHKGNRALKDWRITGKEFKNLYTHRHPEVGDIMCVTKDLDKFIISIIKATDSEYAFLSSFFKGKDNYVIIDLEDLLTLGSCPASTLNYIKLLNLKKNIVFTGAPGTGKTFIAKQIAAAIISGGEREWKDLTATEKKQVGFVQFHPSYDYTDFVEGLRPDAKLNFSRQDGIFKSFCKDALNPDFDGIYNLFLLLTSGKSPLHVTPVSPLTPTPTATTEGAIPSEDRKDDNEQQVVEANPQNDIPKEELKELYDRLKMGEIDPSNLDNFAKKAITTLQKATESIPFIFIIDEINRGELSKIFGELFYSIDPDYRGLEGRVKTQYNQMITDPSDPFKEGFYVPQNVYIIGTMNDVDRGVETMDFAIQRRFAWPKITAQMSAVNMKITGDALTRMTALNAALTEEGLTESYHIGGAYFRKLNAGTNFDDLWEYHLEGVITEYFRGEPDIAEKIERIKNAYYGIAEPTDPNTESSTEEQDS